MGSVPIPSTDNDRPFLLGVVAVPVLAINGVLGDAGTRFLDENLGNRRLADSGGDSTDLLLFGLCGGNIFLSLGERGCLSFD